MNLYSFLALLPYVFSLGISVVVGIYCLRKQNVPGANWYGCLALAQSIWVATSILILSSTRLEEKIFWTSVARLAIFSIPFTYPLFTAEFLGYTARRLALLKIVLAIVPISIAILLLTNNFHHLFYSNAPLISASTDPDDYLSPTPIMQGFGVYGLVVIFGTVIALGEGLVRPNRVYRSQILAIMIATMIPVGTTILELTRVTATDTTPLSFIIRNLIVLWALFRYRLFDIIPIARDTVIENIDDPVVVMDTLDRVIDINPAAAAYIGTPVSQIIGRPLQEVFSEWPELVERFGDVKHAKTQITARVHGQKHYFDFSISQIHDRHNRLIGRVFISREMTERTKLEQRLQRLNFGLEERVRERTEELAIAYDRTLEGWARALELRDKETAGHSARVMETTMRLARALDVPEEELVHIRRGVLLHDIGKMAIPDEILRKGTDLSEDEKRIVSRHPLVAYELLSPIPYLEKALEIPYCHHERWDGLGYPRGLKGQEIPLSARIFAVADIWDALRSDRPYRDAWPVDKILTYMKEQSGVIFDPDVLGIFLELSQNGKL